MPSGDDEMRVAQEPRQRRVEAGIERRVAELVQHRVHPLLAGHDVREHADVAGSVDVDAERVLALAVAREEVAAVEHGARLEPDSVVGAARDLDEVGALEEAVEVDAALGRHLLEERVGVVPRPQIADGAAEPAREPLVERRLPARERLGRRAVRLVERGHQLVLVHLGRRHRESEPVAVAERVRGGVPQPRELADILGDGGADGLRGLPGRAPLVDVVAVLQDLPDLVVVDATPVDIAAVLREAHLDRCLELDDPRAQLSRRLLREEDVVEKVEPAAGRPVGALARDLDRGEPVAVGEEVRERRLELDAPLLVLLVRDDVEIPPGVADLGVRGASSLSI